MANELFVVHVGHNTDHGLEHNVILATENIEVALPAAFSAELMGYDVSFVTVDRLEQNRAYQKRDFRWQAGRPPRQVILYRARCWTDSAHGLSRSYRWEDEWFDEEIRARYEKVMQPVSSL